MLFIKWFRIGSGTVRGQLYWSEAEVTGRRDPYVNTVLLIIFRLTVNMRSLNSDLGNSY